MSGIPDCRKLGYAHMIEMRAIETALRTDGVSGVELYFAAVRTYESLHKNDPSYLERQKAARIRGERWVLGTEAIPTKVDLLRRALEDIRDGHNDPRGLALAVLEAFRP